ncbi:MAG: hypothetical protein WC427_02355 [Candidatus Paceibacterota bacterium]
MYKNIIPQLVSLDTKINGLNGFYLSENFNFFDLIDFKNKYHYKIIIKNDIQIPKEYDFRNEYFLKKGNIWYYERKFFLFSLKLQYDYEKKIFYINRLYTLFPFTIGGILPVGTNISDFINLELFINDYILFRGCSFDYNGTVACITAPGFNGKTSMMGDVLKNGASYIAENNLLISFFEKKVYPTCPFIKNLWNLKGFNHVLKRLFKKNILVKNSKNFTELLLVQNSTSNIIAHNKNIREYLMLNSLYFLDNLFIKSFIFENGILSDVVAKIDKISIFDSDCKFVSIKNFKYNFFKKNE